MRLALDALCNCSSTARACSRSCEWKEVGGRKKRGREEKREEGGRERERIGEERVGRE